MNEWETEKIETRFRGPTGTKRHLQLLFLVLIAAWGCHSTPRNTFDPALAPVGVSGQFSGGWSLPGSVGGYETLLESPDPARTDSESPDPACTDIISMGPGAPKFLFSSTLPQDQPEPEKGAKDGDAGDSKEDKQGSLEEINNKLNNPGADIANLNFKVTWNNFKGDLPHSRSQNSFGINFQPVMPFVLDEDTNLVVRPSFPLVWQPTYDANKGSFDKEFGLGDSQLVALYSKSFKKTGWFAGMGPCMQFPTNTDDDLGKDQFQLGPAVFGGKAGKWGSSGIFYQHFWNVDGTDSSDHRTSFSVIQPWYYFSVGNGWQVGGGAYHDLRLGL